MESQKNTDFQMNSFRVIVFVSKFVGKSVYGYIIQDLRGKEIQYVVSMTILCEPMVVNSRFLGGNSIIDCLLFIGFTNESYKRTVNCIKTYEKKWKKKKKGTL